MSTQNRKHSGPPETGRVREESTSCQAHLSLPGHKGPVVAAGEHAKDEHVLLSVTNPLVIISGWLFRLVKWCRCLDVPVVPNVKTRINWRKTVLQVTRTTKTVRPLALSRGGDTLPRKLLRMGVGVTVVTPG